MRDSATGCSVSRAADTKVSLQFGLGTSLGKDISLLETSKSVTEFLNRHRIELADPNSKRVLAEDWSVKQDNFICRLS